jgi:hypothetical protein
MKRHATSCLIAGPLIWVFGSINNGCQIYERADSQTQILQTSVHVPFLMGSLLFFVSGFFNRRHAYADVDHWRSRIVVSTDYIGRCNGLMGNYILMNVNITLVMNFN